MDLTSAPGQAIDSLEGDLLVDAARHHDAALAARCGRLPQLLQAHLSRIVPSGVSCLGPDLAVALAENAPNPDA